MDKKRRKELLKVTSQKRIDELLATTGPVKAKRKSKIPVIRQTKPR